MGNCFVSAEVHVKQGASSVPSMGTQADGI